MNKTNYIFVFGSNTGGIHGAGAARHARLTYGAEWGVGEGPTGQAYALPTKEGTKDGKIRNTLQWHEIEQSVANFIAYAYRNPQLTFKVTCVGCGLAGLKDSQVAPLFESAPNNCHFDRQWTKYLSGKRTFWGTYGDECG